MPGSGWAAHRSPRGRAPGSLLDVHVRTHHNRQPSFRAQADPHRPRQLSAASPAGSHLHALAVARTPGRAPFIRLSAALDTEEEYTRDMATEALGNTWRRPRSQKAIAERLFDPSVSVRFSALCAVREVNAHTLGCLRRALVAKLADPGKVDDNRVIAAFAAELLRQA